MSARNNRLRTMHFTASELVRLQNVVQYYISDVEAHVNNCPDPTAEEYQAQLLTYKRNIACYQKLLHKLRGPV